MPGTERRHSLAEEVVFGRGFDNSLRVCAKGTGNPEEALEHSNIKEKWDIAVGKLHDERVALQAATETIEPTADHDAAPLEETLTELRKGPSCFPQDSPNYWRSVANMFLRTYVSFVAEPSTPGHLATMVRQSSLQAIRGEDGKSSVLILLDIDLLQEPANRPERKPPAHESLIRKLVHGALIGRGAPKQNDSDSPEATVPVDQDVVVLHDGGRAHMKTALQSPFKLASSTSGALDAQEKQVTVVLNEESVRKRKKRVRGSEPYSLKSTLYFMSSKLLVPDTVPEIADKKYPGYNVGDVVGFVNQRPLANTWHLPPKDKRALFGPRLIVSDAADPELEEPPAAMEPVFSHASLPDDFYTNMFASYSARAVLDLSTGPGEAAKGALTTRIPYLGVCLTEEHARRLEQHLTDWVHSCMKEEGHPLYKAGAASAVAQAVATVAAAAPGAAAAPQSAKADSTDLKAGKQSKRRKSSSSSESSKKGKKKKARKVKHASSSAGSD